MPVRWRGLPPKADSTRGGEVVREQVGEGGLGEGGGLEKGLCSYGCVAEILF